MEANLSPFKRPLELTVEELSCLSQRFVKIYHSNQGFEYENRMDIFSTYFTQEVGFPVRDSYFSRMQISTATQIFKLPFVKNEPLGGDPLRKEHKYDNNAHHIDVYRCTTYASFYQYNHR